MKKLIVFAFLALVLVGTGLYLSTVPTEQLIDQCLLEKGLKSQLSCFYLDNVAQRDPNAEIPGKESTVFTYTMFAFSNAQGSSQLEESELRQRVTNLLERWIALGANLSRFADGAFTPMHQAVYERDPALVRFLLESGAPANLKPQQPPSWIPAMTPLELAKSQLLDEPEDAELLKISALLEKALGNTGQDTKNPAP